MERRDRLLQQAERESGAEAVLPVRRGDEVGNEEYRLPTEAEWEYACRAGSTTRYHFGDEPGSLGEYGWFGENSGSKTPLVGQKRPNAYGLFDMHGNVWEWCWDPYESTYYGKSPVDDPPGATQASYRVVRGGCWGGIPRFCRAADRNYGYTPGDRDGNVGFRVARVRRGRRMPRRIGPIAFPVSPFSRRRANRRVGSPGAGSGTRTLRAGFVG